MLGWEFFVHIATERVPGQPHTDRALANWMTGLGGTDWIDTLVTTGAATDLGGNGGYPCRYSLTAAEFLKAVKDGVPKHKGPDVFSTKYVVRGGWIGEAIIDLERLHALPPDTMLEVEAWDQS